LQNSLDLAEIISQKKEKEFRNLYKQIKNQNEQHAQAAASYHSELQQE
jgi:hypothetical protein